MESDTNSWYLQLVPKTLSHPLGLFVDVRSGARLNFCVLKLCAFEACFRPPPCSLLSLCSMFILNARVLPGISHQLDREDPIQILSFRFFQLFQGHLDLLRGFCTISYPDQHCLPKPAFVQRAKYVCFCSANDSQQLRDFVPLFNFLPVG